MKITRISDFDRCLKIFDEQITIIEKSIDLILGSSSDSTLKQYMLSPLIKDYRQAVALFRDKCTYNDKNYSESDYLLGLEPWPDMPEYNQFVDLSYLY